MKCSHDCSGVIEDGPYGFDFEFDWAVVRKCNVCGEVWTEIESEDDDSTSFYDGNLLLKAREVKP